MKTTNTTSPKVNKTTSTAKRGRPVGSKTRKTADKWKEDWEKFNTINVRKQENGEQVPDSEATVKQVKTFQNLLNEFQNDCKDIELKEKKIVNEWKFACAVSYVAMLLVLVAAIILATPILIELAEVCTQ